MGASCFFGGTFGLVAGVIFSLLFVSFDAGWKKIISGIFSIGVGGGGLWEIYERYQVTDSSTIFTSMGCLCASFLIAFIIFLFIMCKIIKDNDDKDVLRIRDILLGQKKYIEAYYKQREKEIDDKLNIPVLEKREQDVSKRELLCDAKLESLERDREELDKLTDNKLKIKLPEKKNLVVTKEFLDLFPSYVENLGEFIHGINSETKLFLENHEDCMTYEDLRVFLTLLSLQILAHLFHKNATDVRVHFRYYDKEKDGFKKLTSMVASKEYKRELTFIPCNRANMIMKSFECRRALIKSHNIEYDYDGANSTTWTEYMTGAFYNITTNGKPCISFGISVKNATKYKHLFNFLNYCKFESYLQEVIEQLNECHNIETILYGDHIM